MMSSPEISSHPGISYSYASEESALRYLSVDSVLELRRTGANLFAIMSAGKKEPGKLSWAQRLLSSSLCSQMSRILSAGWHKSATNISFKQCKERAANFIWVFEKCLVERRLFALVLLYSVTATGWDKPSTLSRCMSRVTSLAYCAFISLETNGQPWGCWFSVVNNTDLACFRYL